MVTVSWWIDRMPRVCAHVAAIMVIVLGGVPCLAQRPGPAHAQHADLQQLDQLGRALADAGRIDEAIRLYKALVPMVEAWLGPTHPNLASRPAMPGYAYTQRERYGDPVPVVQRALALFEKAHGSRRTTVGIGHLNLANAFLGLGRAEETERNYKRALVIFEKTAGAEHPSTDVLAWGAAPVRQAFAFSRRCSSAKAASAGCDHGAVFERTRTDWLFKMTWPVSILR